MATYVGIGTTDPGDDMIFGDNKVGIGTTSPGDSLEVQGNLAIIPSADAYPTLQMLDYSHDNIAINFDSYFRGDWKSSDSGSNFRIYKIGDTLRFSYASGVDQGSTIGAWGSENTNCAISINASGQVGIGTTSASYDLDVVGTAKASTAVKTPAIRPVTDGPTALQFQKTDGTSVLNVDTTNSRVGIGTTSPSNKLSVIGSADIYGDVEIENTVTIGRNVGIGTSPDNDATLQTVSSYGYNRVKLYTYSDYDHTNVLEMKISHTNTVGQKTTTISGDDLGLFEWYGVNADATPDFAKGARISVYQDGNAGTTYVPASMDF